MSRLNTLVGTAPDVKGTLEGVQKVAVVRANGIGDFMFALPALEALRARFPQADIVLLGKAWHQAFLKGRPGPVDRVIVIPACPGVGEDPGMAEDRPALDRFFGAMARERFDLAIQLHGGGRYSNPFVQRLGARFTLGLKTPDAAPLDRWVPYLYFQPEVMRYLEVMSLVDAVPVRLEPRVEVTRADLAQADQALPEDGRPLVVLHVGASDPRRWWPADSFAAVGDALAQTGARVVIIGTEPERPAVEAVLAAMKREVEDLYGCLSLNGLAGLLSRCAVMVSNDSGPLHLAAAVGAATVGIYWCGNFYNGAPFTRTCHRPFVSWRIHCPVCGQNTFTDPCQHQASFVADVAVEEVISSALDLLNSGDRSGHRYPAHA
jgi:ADP-heptose:LPS heptosyltransferase